MVKYLTPERIIENNLLILNILKVKKADKPLVLNYSKIKEIIDECKTLKGDIHDKAVVLFIGLIRKHPFASGNRRTAFITVKEFLILNAAKFCIKEDPENAKVMTGIREGFYTYEEIKGWLKDGKIRRFER